MQFKERTANEILARACTHVDAESAQDKLKQLCRILVEVGAHTNLTAVRTYEAALVLHVADALALIPAIDARGANGTASIVDVGAGAGFPGIPLAIARPHIRVACIEATRKKVDFQRDAVAQLGLANVEPCWCRAEDAAHGPKRQRYDVAVARAVARLDRLAEICLPFVKTNGLLLAQKSVDKNEEEIVAASRALKQLGAEIVDVQHQFTEDIIRDVVSEFQGAMGISQIDGAEDDRRKCIVVIKKNIPTPSKYPRSFSAIKRNPL